VLGSSSAVTTAVCLSPLYVTACTTARPVKTNSTVVRQINHLTVFSGLRCYLKSSVAQWLERLLREREVVGLIPDCVIPKTL